jgi:diguanylate cyclase (GGDEF)-like protein
MGERETGNRRTGESRRRVEQAIPDALGPLEARIEALSRATRIAIPIVLTLLIGGVDYATGFELSIGFFYLLPVAFAAWFAGRRNAIVISVLCAATWQMSDRLAGEHVSNSLIPFWNALTRFGFFFVVATLIARIRLLLERERSFARTDFTTGVQNKRAFEEQLDAEILRCGRYGHSFILAYLDVDDFKEVNDAHSHATGDALLRDFASAIRSTLRSSDVVGRLGGDEFAVLFVETDGASAQSFVERMQAEVRERLREYEWNVTFSVGAIVAGGGSDADEVIHRADELMYAAKRAGKNRIVCETDSPKGSESS